MPWPKRKAFKNPRVKRARSQHSNLAAGHRLRVSPGTSIIMGNPAWRSDCRVAPLSAPGGSIMKIKNLLYFSCFVLFTSLLIACGSKEPLRIGFIAGTSGRVADLGVGGRNGVTLALELRNAAGGINGRKIELVARDDQQNPEKARAAVQELIEQKVAAILGPMTSAMAMQVVPFGNQHHVVVLGGTVTTNQLTGKDDYFFRVLAPTKKFASANAVYQLKLGHKRFAVAYDLRNRAYTESWLMDYKGAVESGGGKVIKNIGFESGNDVPFGDIAEELLSTKPDCIVFIANSVDAANLVQQVRKRNRKIALSTSEWAGTERFIQLAGRAAEGVVLGQYLDRYSTQLDFIEFRKRYLKRFSQEPGYPAMVSYNAANVLFEAIARQRDGEELKQTLFRIKTFKGLQEPTVFDQYGDAGSRPYLVSVKDGKFVVINNQ